MFDQYVMDVADFTFVKKLSRGAFATVYLAKRKDTGQHCAIKVALLRCDAS
jgi:serine/threonine protein kinase